MPLGWVSSRHEKDAVRLHRSVGRILADVVRKANKGECENARRLANATYALLGEARAHVGSISGRECREALFVLHTRLIRATDLVDQRIRQVCSREGTRR